MAGHSLAYISCDCLILHKYAAPVACTIQHSQNLSWREAQTFASAHNLEIIFASQSTASKISKARQPLPTTVLMSQQYMNQNIGHGTGSTVVCGEAAEMKKESASGGAAPRQFRDGGEPTTGVMNEILGVFILFLMLYGVVDYLRSRTSMECGRIDLEGTKRKLSVCKEDISDDYPEEEEIHRQGVPSS